MENPNLPTNINQSLMLSENDLDIDIIRYLRPQTNEPVNEHPDIDSTQLISSGLNSNLILNYGFIKSGSHVSGSDGWKINSNGNVEFNDGNFRGDITGATGTFTGTVTVGSLDIPDSITANSFHVDTDGNAWWGAILIGDSNAKILKTGAATFTSATITGALTTGAGSSVDGQYIGAGSVASTSVNLALRGWTFTGTFSATDYRILAWTLGTFTASDGTAYNITASNTGNMAALTYIYLDIAISTTALQITTTATTAIGNGKVLIGTAVNNSDTTSKASFQIFGGAGGERVFVDNISANSASTNEFVSNTAQIASLIVTDAKINTMSANKIIAGTGIVNSLSVLSTLTIGSAGTNGIIQSYGWNGTVNGFQILGGTTPTITLIGGTITGGIIQTSATGERIKLSSVSSNKIEMLNGNTVIGYMEVDYDSDEDEGYLKIEDGSGSGLLVTSDLGASYFGSAELISLGGTFLTGGSTSAGVIGMFAGDGVSYVRITRTSGPTYALSTDLPLAMGSNKITGLGTPTADYDAATKKYVYDYISQLAGNISSLTTSVTWIINNCC